MEQTLATTEAGQKRLNAAEGRMNTRLAKEVEEADARPERGGEAAGPDIGLDDPPSEIRCSALMRQRLLEHSQLHMCLEGRGRQGPPEDRAQRRLKGRAR